jgi:hypothetical protein
MGFGGIYKMAIGKWRRHIIMTNNVPNQLKNINTKEERKLGAKTFVALNGKEEERRILPKTAIGSPGKILGEAKSALVVAKKEEWKGGMAFWTGECL